LHTASGESEVVSLHSDVGGQMYPWSLTRREEDILEAGSLRSAQGRKLPQDSLHGHFGRASEPELTLARGAKRRKGTLVLAGGNAMGSPMVRGSQSGTAMGRAAAQRISTLLTTEALVVASGQPSEAFMITPLRPMSTGEILDRTFNLYRNNFLLFAGIAVLPPALMLVVQLIQAGMVATPGHPRAAGAGLTAVGGLGVMLGWFAYLVGLAVAHAATVFAVSAVHLGRTTTISESYGRVRGHYGRVAWVLVQASLRAFWPLVLIVMIAGLMIGIAGGKGAGAAVAGGLMALGIVVGGIVGLVLYLRYALAVPACVLEDINASAAIKRSVTLSAGCRGQIFVIYFLMGVINAIVTWVFLLPAMWLATLLAKGSPAVTILATGLAGFLAGALAGPIATIALSLVYFDQRVRRKPSTSS